MPHVNDGHRSRPLLIRLDANAVPTGTRGTEGGPIVGAHDEGVG